jgi:hypothetical protein
MSSAQLLLSLLLACIATRTSSQVPAGWSTFPRLSYGGGAHQDASSTNAAPARSPTLRLASALALLRLVAGAVRVYAPGKAGARALPRSQHPDTRGAFRPAWQLQLPRGRLGVERRQLHAVVY